VFSLSLSLSFVVAARESKGKADDSIELVDLTDYVLTVEVLRAQALVPVAEKGASYNILFPDAECLVFLQLSFSVSLIPIH